VDLQCKTLSSHLNRSNIRNSSRRLYLGRLALTTYYNYRTSRLQTHLEELQTQRDITIDKLKAATKYNSTQQLLEKYGGTPSPKASPSQRALPRPNQSLLSKAQSWQVQVEQGLYHPNSKHPVETALHCSLQPSAHAVRYHYF
jgi:hypothetical protein